MSTFQNRHVHKGTARTKSRALQASVDKFLRHRISYKAEGDVAMKLEANMSNFQRGKENSTFDGGLVLPDSDRLCGIEIKTLTVVPNAASTGRQNPYWIGRICGSPGQTLCDLFIIAFPCLREHTHLAIRPAFKPAARVSAKVIKRYITSEAQQQLYNTIPPALWPKTLRNQVLSEVISDIEIQRWDGKTAEIVVTNDAFRFKMQ